MAELVSLDPSVKPVATGYFNHSYVPDFIVEWKDGAARGERPVYLRHSLASSRASGDYESLARVDKSALFMSLSRDEPATETQKARAVVREHTQARSLITTVPAVDELTQIATESDPVLNVVRSSVVRSAKGFLQGSDVEKFILPRSQRINAEDIEAFNEAVEASFSEEAVYRINRVSAIVEQATANQPNIGSLFMSGQLTEQELRELIPYLLSLEGVTHNRECWKRIAELVSLEVIERHWSDFAGLDLTPLATAATEVWVATRAQLSARSEAIDDDEYDPAPRWTVRGRALSAEVGAWRVAFAHAGAKLKVAGRSLSDARWDELKPALTDYTVTAVDLSGLVTQSVYGAVETADMKDRIDSFIEGADDSFHVPGVTITTGQGDSTATIRADFRERMLTATPDASVGSLARVAVEVLGYRYPTQADELAILLGERRNQARRPEDLDQQ